jgi:hypothetical protein
MILNSDFLIEIIFNVNSNSKTLLEFVPFFKIN